MSVKSDPAGLEGVDAPNHRGRDLLVPQRCLKCQAPLDSAPGALACAACGARWPVRDGVPFYSSAEYFGEVGQAEMATLIQRASQTDWRTAIRTQFKEDNPELYGYIADLNRASWIPLLPLGPKSTVLDVGSGLGALTHTLALNYERVISTEPVDERVRFTRIRLEQEGLTNVDLIQTTVDALPFYDKTFDLIVLNGILEWVAAWRHEGRPRDVQLDILRKLRGMLKPGGVLLLGIENRIGVHYFLGRVDHSGLAFTSLMPRWLASMYLKLRQPGFHRTLLTSSLGYRTYTYSPRGYRKLLAEAGFGDVDLWWPLNGYNLPHVMYRIADRAEIRKMAVDECNAANRINGYAFRRVVKQRVLNETGLLYATSPDLVMLARSGTNGHGNHYGQSSLVEAIQKVLTPAVDERRPAPEPSHVSVLMGHKLRNKSILKFATPSGVITGIAKVANRNLPRADAVEHAYRLLQRLHGLFESGGAPLMGSIPSPVTLIHRGPLTASVEAPASGVSLGQMSLEPHYLTDRQRVTRHLETIAAWLVAAQPKLALLQPEFTPRGIRFEWRMMPGRDGQRLALADRPSWVQHGDFFPTNVFIDETPGRLGVIDWDNCNSGYPPLFDWFCFVTGLYYTHHRISRLPKGQTVDPLSFQQTFFEPSWFADTVVALTVKLSTSLGVDSGRIVDHFEDYLAVRYHQFNDDRDSGSKEQWGRRFKEFHAFFVENQDLCIFHPRHIR